MSTGGSRAREPGWVDSETRILIDDYTIRIRDSRTYHNSLSPVSSLPFEALAEIFKYHRARHDKYIDSKSFSWVDITVVCRHWREVALKSPSLWCSIRLIDNVGPIFVQQFLDRSRGLPLTLILSFQQIEPFEALRAVLLQSHRIKAMDISLKKDHYEFLYAHHEFRSLPSLQRLTLAKPMCDYRASYGDDGVSYMPSYVTPSIPHEKFDMLAIRELVVTGYELGEHSSIWTQHLTSLQLQVSYEDTPSRDILGTLSSLQNLQTLNLSSEPNTGVVGDYGTPFSLDTPVQLCHLQQLHLSGSILNCVSILSNLVFPASATLSIETDQYQEERQLPWLVQCLVSHLSGTHRIGKAKPVYSCAFSQEHGIENCPIQANIRLWERDVSCGQYHCDVSDDPPPEFKLAFGLSNIGLRTFTKKVFLRLPLRSVTSLSLMGDIPQIFEYNLPIFSKLCEAMPNVTSLNSRDQAELFPSDCGPDFLSIEPHCILLGQLPPQNDPPTSPTSRGASQEQDSGRTQLVHAPRYGFSQLKTLRLEGIAFQPASTTPWSYKTYVPVNPEEYTKTMNTWINVLQDRCRDGFPITTLVLRNCYRVGAEDVQRFRNAVRDVRWDGNVLVKSECESDDRPWLLYFGSDTESECEHESASN